ncbi:MAG: 50S ribosomal protein L11 methyltransferase, partial [Burkholderiales bacterium]|nr:50S ribosomal protein L11 methyltransferase [Burkholderiales bacterium]
MTRPIADAPAFVRSNTRLLAVPHAPEILLHVADEATPLWTKTEDELGEMGLPPPFWAFAWAGGQALARHLLDHPGLVAGRSVLDFASGSGLAGIAAARAGAATVAATDIDAFAVAAIAINAEANGVSLIVAQADVIGSDEGWDVVLAGDVFYERDMAARVSDWLGALARRGAVVLVGDPGRSYLPRERMQARGDTLVAHTPRKQAYPRKTPTQGRVKPPPPQET